MAIVALLFVHVSAFAQRPILLTEDARTLGAGRFEFGAGVEHLEKSDAPELGSPAALSRIGQLAAHIGVAERVNLDLDWRGRLLSRSDDGTRGADWGDLTVATKINILTEFDNPFALGMRTAVKLPNTSYLPYRIGSDQTDFSVSLLAMKSWPSFSGRLNLGFAILGNPREPGSQDDIYSVTAAMFVPALFVKSILFVEGYAGTGYKDDDDKVLGRFGVLTSIGDFLVSAYGSARLAGTRTDFGGAFEMTEDWSAGLFVMQTIQF